MHVEIRKLRGGKKYYLAHSYRKGGKVRKLRIYLGENLSPDELAEAKRMAEAKLTAKISAQAGMRDPLEAALSPQELKELRTLEAMGEIRIAHLSEEDWQKFVESFAYDTNAIEGSTVSYKEVEEILEKDNWPDKPKEEISETYGVANAIAFIRKTKEHISLPLILELHRLVFGNSKPFAGKLRPPGVEVAVVDGARRIVHQGAPSSQVRSLLFELVRWYSKNRRRYPPLVLAAVIHNQFENIHPFQDGNGRVGRLLLNNMLLKNGLPPVNIEMKHRSEYYAALQKYEHGHDLRPTLNLLLKEYKALKRMLGKKR
ncbi:MAG: Fic family protein [Candidatus Burarchaeum sp.]|nr:Fic family protein [Candidatus Burarchaeum sp.]MDO8339491.1 Fic family protein [Candidatus Burarchaeum sp.]